MIMGGRHSARVKVLISIRATNAVELAWKPCASHDVPVPRDVILHPLGLQDLTLWLSNVKA
jgi:hypothetical protein